MLEVTMAAWAATIGLVVALLVADLALSARTPHAVSFRAAVVQSLSYIGVAIAFGVVFGTIAGCDYGSQYFAGWVVEKSLSIDNLFALCRCPHSANYADRATMPTRSSCGSWREFTARVAALAARRVGLA